MKNTLTYQFLEVFKIAAEVGAMFTIAGYLIEITVVHPDKGIVEYMAYDRPDEDE